MMNNKKQPFWLPYLVALLSFAAVSMSYFAPQYSGKVLPMHDDMQYWGQSQDIKEHKAKYNEDPQWGGSMFGGMPSYLINFDYKTQVLKSVDKTLRFLGNPAALLFIAMAGFFFMLVLYGVNPWIGIIPSLAYGLSTYTLLIIGAGHLAKVLAMAYAPMMIGGVIYTYRRNMWMGAALTALFAAIEIMVNHPQITYYFILVLLAFWINEGVQAFREKTLPKFAKATGVLAIAAVLAVGANFSSLWYVAQHTKDTIRGGSELTAMPGEVKNPKGLDIEYATAWSYGKLESFNLFIPDFMGGASDGGFSEDGEVAQALTKYGERKMATRLPAYWGDQSFTAGPTYIGAVIVFLFIFGLFYHTGRCRWWVLAVSLLALFLSWGKNMMWLTELFFNYFPMYNKFRTVSMIQVILQWSMPFLAAIALHDLWTKQIDRKRLLNALKYSLTITGGFALFFILAGGSLFSFSSPIDSQLPQDVADAMRGERASMLRADSFRSLVFVLLTATTIFMLYANKIKRGVFLGILAGLVVIDLVVVDLRYMPHSKFIDAKDNTIKPTAADIEILKDTEPGYRVANFSVSTFNDATTSYFHRSIGGYHGAKLQRYQDLIDRHLSKNNMEVFNMLNTKYFIVPNQETGAPEPQFNRGAFGAAWIVNEISFVNSADDEIMALNDIDLRENAVVDSRFKQMIEGVDIQKDSTASIALAEYRVNYLKYEYSAEKENIAVFSEIYYDKGWSAYIDGLPAKYFRADYVLRAMAVPSGQHTIEFRFSAPNFSTVAAITRISSILILLCVVAAAGYSFRKCKKRRKDAEQ